MIKYVITFLIIICLTSAEDYYDLFGVSKNADQREIRKAFKTIAVTHHPDKNQDDPKAHEKFIKLTKAYEILKDPESRKKYDLYGEKGFENINTQPNYHSWNYYKYNFGIYDNDPQVVTLNRNDYYENVFYSEKMWLVNFYSARCGSCHHLAPIWRKIAEEFEGVIKVGAVNCEDDFQLCQQVGIRAYPALLYIAKNSTGGRQYAGERTYDAIKDFVLNKLNINIPEISLSNWKRLIKDNKLIKKPTLVFAYKNKEECLSSNDLLKVAAIFDKTLNIQLLHCKENECNDISDNTCAILLPIKSEQTWLPVHLKNIENFKDLVEQVLEQLPEPKSLTDDEFEEIRRELRKEPGMGWLICFYIGHSTELDLILKKLPNFINTINLGKINCGRYGYLCNTLDINRYPMWGVLKPGGAFELSHGKNEIYDIAMFTTSSIKAKNLWALSADKILSILQRNSGNEVWYLDWYAPWCPSCMNFLPELRKASMQFNKSVVHFGTIDCTVHSSICRKYNIRSYPTSMLVNGTKTYQFTAYHKSAAEVIQFINDIRSPSVIQISANNFNQYLEKDKDKTIWIIDYFVGWCAPCQHLATEWNAVAKILNILPFVKVANVDCEVENNLCRSQEVGSYPNIRLYPRDRKNLNKAVKYDGPHETWNILKWISKYFPTKVYDLDPNSLRKKVFSGKNVWLVDFYAPWCSHCQTLDPHISIAAQLFNNKVNFGKFNCELYRAQCSQVYGVKAYPTLIIYDKKHDIKDIDKGFQIMATSAEMIHEKVLNYLNSKKKNKHDEL